MAHLHDSDCFDKSIACNRKSMPDAKVEEQKEKNHVSY